MQWRPRAEDIRWILYSTEEKFFGGFILSRDYCARRRRDIIVIVMLSRSKSITGRLLEIQIPDLLSISWVYQSCYGYANIFTEYSSMI